MHPPGARVARWYCPQGHCTFSLLPDCLAARLAGTLVELEAVVAIAEQASSLEAAANAARRDDIGLVCAMRWVRRRREAVHANLLTIKALLPEHFVDCEPSVNAVRQHLGSERALQACRHIAAESLHRLAPPVGFFPCRVAGGERRRGEQHRRGPDPPLISR